MALAAYIAQLTAGGYKAEVVQPADPALDFQVAANSMYIAALLEDI